MCACWSLSTSQVRGCSGASPTGGSWPSGARQSGWNYSGNSACLAGGRAGLKKEGEPPTPALAPHNCHPAQAPTWPASPPCAAAAAGHNLGAVPQRTRGVDALARQRGLDVGGLHHRAGGQVQDGHADADLVGLVHLVHLPAGCRRRMARGRGSRGRVRGGGELGWAGGKHELMSLWRWAGLAEPSTASQCFPLCHVQAQQCGQAHGASPQGPKVPPSPIPAQPPQVHAPLSRPSTPGVTSPASTVQVARLLRSALSMDGRLRWLRQQVGGPEGQRGGAAGLAEWVTDRQRGWAAARCKVPHATCLGASVCIARTPWERQTRSRCLACRGRTALRSVLPAGAGG